MGWAFLFPEFKKITCFRGPYISSGLSSTVTLSEASFLNIGLEQSSKKYQVFCCLLVSSTSHPLSTCSMERRNGKRKEREVAFETVLVAARGKMGLYQRKSVAFFTLYFLSLQGIVSVNLLRNIKLWIAYMV